MPAVSPARLERQVDDVVEVFADPARLRARCVDLLEFYASRIRSTGGGGSSGTIRSLGVPAAVLRALEQRLRRAAEADPHAGAQAAETLWATSVMEARWLAVGLLELQPIEKQPDWVMDWSETAEDAQLLERLASGPLTRLRALDAEVFWTTVAAGLAADGPPTTLALIALRDVLPNLDADELPRVFAELEAAPVPLAGEAWRAYVEVVQAAARRSPPETARFLVDEIENSRPGSTRLARQTLADFPPRQRESLRYALRLTESASLPRPRPPPHS